MKTFLQNTVLYLCVLLSVGIVKAENRATIITTEICYNGIDDNGDGLVDNEDPMCQIIRVSTTSDVLDGDVGSVTRLKNDPGADGLISLREAITATQSAASLNEFHTIGFALKNYDQGHFYYQDDGIADQVTDVNKVRTTAIDDSTIDDKDEDFPRSWFQFSINSPLPALSDNVLIDGYDLRRTQANEQEFGTTLNTAIRVEITTNGNFPIFTINQAINSDSKLIIRGLCLNGLQEVIQITEGTKGEVWLYGNFFGIAPTALSEVVANQSIITIKNSNRPIFIGSNRDGLTDEKEVNLIAGVSSDNAGIYLENTQQVTISQNYFGLGLTSDNHLNGNQGTAIISKGSSKNKIHKNIISYFENGIKLDNAQADSILYNLIGTNSTNGNSSIIADIGGSCTDCEEVKIYKNSIANSYIGWSFQGLTQSHFIENEVYNNLTIGINLSASSPDGTGKNEENFIYKNTVHDNLIGLLIGTESNNNALIQNSFYNHGSIGIDIIKNGTEADGINENDVNDLDQGANQLLNYPTLTVTNYTITEATVKVDLDIDDAFTDQEGYRIEFFANSSPTDRGGEIYLGYLDTNGDVTNEEITLFLPPPVTNDYQIAATTSSIKYAAFTNLVPEIAFIATSELGASVPLPNAEICDNNMDDDGDGLIDCADPDCANYDFAGIISGDQLSCHFFDPEPIKSESTPLADERATVFYQWQKSTNDGDTWEDIPDATEANFDPFRIDETILYRRLVKKHICNDWLISNTIKKRIKIINTAEIIMTPEDSPWCSGVPYTFEAVDAGPGSTYIWEFGDSQHTAANPLSGTGKGPHTVFFNGGGGNRVILEVQQEGCSKTTFIGQNIHPILEINNVSITQPTTCGGTDGSISLDISGKSGSCIEVSIDGGDTFLPENQFEINDLPTGAYHVMARYCQEGCPINWGIIALAGPSEIIANDDDISGFCPGVLFQGTVVNNDTFGDNPVFSLAADATYGRVTIADDGRYTYTPITNTCNADQFSYQVCNGNTGCCAIAVVNVTFGDDQAPTFGDLPVDITIGIDDEIPAKAEVTAVDNCPSTFIDFEEVSTQTNNDCGKYNYTITRTWTASDRCGNAISHVQTISVVDETAPDVFRIHTLPNGKKMLAGVMEFTSEHWKTVHLPFNFSDNPIIFTQLVTNNEETTATVRLRNVSQNQFQIKLQEAAIDDGTHLKEEVAWMAMESGEQTGDFHWQADTLPVNHSWTTISFENSFANIPLLFANMQTINDEDAATVRNNGVNWNNGKVRIQEENSVDPNLAHTAETLGYLAIENDLDLRNESGETVGETGKATVTNEWKTIFLDQTYNNPVVIANSLTIDDFDAASVRVRFVTSKSFQIRVAEWSYMDDLHLEETVGYLVIEGSLPLEVTNFCDNNNVEEDFSSELIALDNTGNILPISYDERIGFSSGFQLTYRDWFAQDACDNIGVATQEVYCPGIAFQAKTILQGALLGSNEAHLMRDDLRKSDLIPTVEPYTELVGFERGDSEGGEELKAELLEVEGSDAIVDWVFFELRSRFNKRHIIATTVGLVQRDGDVVSPRGDSLLTFPVIYQNEYYVSVRHRNHVCMISSEPQVFTNRNIPMFDFTAHNTSGTYAGTQMENRNVMWAGDLNQDNKIIYQGPNNDIFNLFLDILLDPDNTKKITNFVSKRYASGDFNLDGKVIFQGPDNDRSALLFNTTLVHPENTDYFSNFILQITDKDGN